MKALDYLIKWVDNLTTMGRGRKKKTQKMINRKRQAKKRIRLKKRRETVRKSRAT
ncbi:MAG: hypothetical protein AABZ55_01900 [Bdellovibrionota bacterium]